MKNFVAKLLVVGMLASLASVGVSANDELLIAPQLTPTLGAAEAHTEKDGVAPLDHVLTLTFGEQQLSLFVKDTDSTLGWRNFTVGDYMEQLLASLGLAGRLDAASVTISRAGESLNAAKLADGTVNPIVRSADSLAGLVAFDATSRTLLYFGTSAEATVELDALLQMALVYLSEQPQLLTNKELVSALEGISVQALEGSTTVTLTENLLTMLADAYAATLPEIPEIPEIPEEPEAPIVAEEGASLIILGDSIMTGYGLTDLTGSAANTAAGMLLGEDETAENLAVNGLTLAQLVEMIGTLDEKWAENAENIVISIGGNDVLALADSVISSFSGGLISLGSISGLDQAATMLSLVSLTPEQLLQLAQTVQAFPATYAANWSALLAELPADANIALVTMPNPARTYQLAGVGGDAVATVATLIDSLNAGLAQTVALSGAENIAVVDINAIEGLSYQADGIHPDAASHAALGEAIGAALNALNGEK